MTEIPKKNISARMSDVRTQSDSIDEDAPWQAPVEKPGVEEIFAAPKTNPLIMTDAPSRPAHFRLTKKIFGVALVVFVVSSVAMGGAVWAGKRALFRMAAEGQSNLDAAIESLQSLDFTSASHSLKTAKDNFEAQTPDSKMEVFAKIYKEFNALLPATKKSANAFSQFGAIAEASISLADKVRDVAVNAGEYFDEKSDKNLIPALEEITGLVTDIKSRSLQLSASSKDAGSIAPFAADAYLPLSVSLETMERSLQQAVSWLKEDKEHVIVVLFQNSAELRATGGFIGSFAKVHLLHGKVKSFTVHDINDVDTTFSDKVIPPKPVQVISKRWFPSDANWNFDFPSSASRIADMMERSKMFSDSQTKIDAVVAITPKVGRDILRVSGPLKLGNGKTITADSFLADIQEDVQKKQAERSDAPKSAVSQSVSALLAATNALPADKKDSLISVFQDWIESKDIMIYSRNADIQKSLDLALASGRMMDLPANFNGDYFAVVFDTLQGGKSDAFVKRKITLQSQLGLDGIVSNHVIIESAHKGDKAKNWWYKEENKGYLRVYTPAGAMLESAKGVWEGQQSSARYNDPSFTPDSLVASIEATKKENLSIPAVSSFAENKRNVFSSWVKVSPGKTQSTTLDYSFRAYDAPHEGQKYQFVFEKQPGVDASYVFDISAPVGYVWKESGLPVYELAANELPGRLVIDMTLAKD